jgi:hypothetical protein
MKVITILRKPLDGSVADNTLEHGCGGLNIDECRVGVELITTNGWGRATLILNLDADYQGTTRQGRWPANFILSHSDGCDSDCVEGCPIKEMDTQSGDVSRFFMQFQQERKD